MFAGGLRQHLGRGGSCVLVLHRRVHRQGQPRRLQSLIQPPRTIVERL